MMRLLLPTQRVCTCGANAMGKDFQEWQGMQNVFST